MSVTGLDAADLAARLGRGELAAAEVMAAFLDRIEAVNPRINAIVSLAPREALMAEAEAADRAPRRGSLHGLPIAVKDLVATAGIRTTWGSPIFADHVPEADDAVARRLRAGGRHPDRQDQHARVRPGLATPSTRSSARPETPTTPPAPPAGRRAVPRRRSPRGWCRWRTGRT